MYCIYIYIYRERGERERRENLCKCNTFNIYLWDILLVTFCSTCIFVKALILFFRIPWFDNMKVFAITLISLIASLIIQLFFFNINQYIRKKNLQTINFCKVVCIKDSLFCPLLFLWERPQMNFDWFNYIFLQTCL